MNRQFIDQKIRDKGKTTIYKKAPSVAPVALLLLQRYFLTKDVLTVQCVLLYL